ncbi:putative type I restriction enzymeP M protein [Pontiella desulfatans]|uniref:site-specific DNA-methyltransferase (adenine-specific) n=1 Tax=Pontiella desulfatans TaxID=2750659 RepID=A0A6C2UAZ4_PONDE|nr:N-6 DNA methylase [Pontiella desulfatans]VGO17195.1 putative type I restriction enzymeP M protein [Pontiella desulfatans]
MAQLENIEAIEKRLWSAADLLRTGSNYASNEYFMPVMGLVFLRHAYSRFLNVKDDIVASLPSRGGKTRDLTKADFSQKGAIFLQEKAQFDYLVSLSDDKDRAAAVVEAMESIEADYETLSGVLPKAEYHELDNEVLGTLLRTLNPDELKKASGDIFGRIYEYFLTQFANDKAHDGGEFFTPVSLVSLIAHVLEPERGSVLDPACGSGGMFVQSAKFVEQMKANPSERLTFYGLEKNPTTIRLGKMNLAVHGLEGDIRKAISYYEDPHELLGKADYVMANPPFNTDEVDAEKVKRDPRLPFGLPGVNKKEKVSNGNYLWISYFYSYLSEKGRAGFVMSSQASSAGGEEAKVRQKLIETGAVEAMIDVRGNFFYTRSVPCQLWFFNKDKPAEHKDKVLMVDARNVYRKVTRKIFDFTPEQEKNLNSIFWLYRGQNERFIELVQSYVDQVLNEAHSCFVNQGNTVSASEPLPDFIKAVNKLFDAMKPFLDSLPEDGAQAETDSELRKALGDLDNHVGAYDGLRQDTQKQWNESDSNTVKELHFFADEQSSPALLAEGSRDLVKLADHAYKLATRLIELCEKELDAKSSDLWKSAEINGARKSNLRKEAEAARKDAVEQLKRVRYFYKQAHWLLSRFPDGELRDVEGLVKLVNHTELASNDWSLTPGRYVGVAPEEVDEDFDFEEALRDIHVELAGLNEEAVDLAAKIARNFEELGV